MEASNNKSNWRQHGVQIVCWIVAHRDKDYDNKFIRKVYGLLRKIIDREDEHDR